MTSRERITINKRSRRRPATDLTMDILGISQEINQALAMTLGMYIHNRLAPFRAKHLSDAAMPELDATIRYTIYDFFMNVASDEPQLAILVASVPEDWAVPGLDPQPTFDPEPKRRSSKPR